jgi:hypothetical protein
LRLDPRRRISRLRRFWRRRSRERQIASRPITGLALDRGRRRGLGRPRERQIKRLPVVELPLDQRGRRFARR